MHAITLPKTLAATALAMAALAAAPLAQAGPGAQRHPDGLTVPQRHPEIIAILKHPDGLVMPQRHPEILGVLKHPDILGVLKARQSAAA